MAVVRSSPKHSTDSTNLADLLERVLDKGVVIAGDIKVSLLDIELLTIQIRLVVCSIDKAKEMGMDWWANTPVFMGPKHQEELPEGEGSRAAELEALQARVKELEATLGAGSPSPEPEQPRFRRREETP